MDEGDAMSLAISWLLIAKYNTYDCVDPRVISGLNGDIF